MATEQQTSPLQRFPEQLRSTRQGKGLGVRELAARAHVTPAMISMIERGKIKPSVDTLYELGLALSVPVSALFAEEPKTISDVVVQRPDERVFVPQRIGRFHYEDAELTGDGFGPAEIQPSLVRLHRSSFAPVMNSLRGDQLIYGMAGQFKYACGDEVHTITPGDSLFFDSHMPHGPKAVETETAEYVICYVDEVYGWIDMRLDPRKLLTRPPKAPEGLTAAQRMAWRIRYARSKRGYLQATVRARTGLSYGMVSHIESGRSKPSMATLELIANALHVPMAYFFDDESNMCRATFIAKHEQRAEARHDGGHRYQAYALAGKDFGEPLFNPELRVYERKGFVAERTKARGQFFIMALTGTLEVYHGARDYVLEPGDTIYGVSSVQHGVRGLQSERAEALYFRSDLRHYLTRVLEPGSEKRRVRG